MSLPWFRFYHEVLDDPKVQRLDPATFKHWVNILCIAARNDGRLPPPNDTAFLLRIDEIAFESVVDRLLIAGLIDVRKGGANGSYIAPHGWEQRQYKSDTSTDRVKRFRERSKTVTVTPPETDTESDTESKRETNVSRQSDARANCEIVVSRWNAMASAHKLSKCEKLSDKRAKACHARLRDDGLDAICQAIEKIPQSSFLLGLSGDWNGANFDFLLRPDSITKILEGKYDDKTKPSRPLPSQNGGRKDGAAAALDRQLGLDDFAGSSGRCDVGESAGHSQRALSGPRAVWG